MLLTAFPPSSTWLIILVSRDMRRTGQPDQRSFLLRNRSQLSAMHPDAYIISGFAFLIDWICRACSLPFALLSRGWQVSKHEVGLVDIRSGVKASYGDRCAIRCPRSYLASVASIYSFRDLPSIRRGDLHISTALLSDKKLNCVLKIFMDTIVRYRLIVNRTSRSKMWRFPHESTAITGSIYRKLDRNFMERRCRHRSSVRKASTPLRISPGRPRVFEHLLYPRESRGKRKNRLGDHSIKKQEKWWDTGIAWPKGWRRLLEEEKIVDLWPVRRYRDLPILINQVMMAEGC